MKWLVTGCTGLLGANACNILKECHDVVGVSRGSFSMDGVVHYPTSFTDAVAIEEVIEKERPDVILHCAAMTNVDACEQDPDSAMMVNASASAKLADIAGHAGVRFIFISSDAVFDGTKPEAYSESDRTNPLSVYGRSKATAEELVLQNAEALVVRTNMYGFNWGQKSSLSEWVMDSLQQSIPIRMFSDVLFSPLLVNTLVKSLESAIMKGCAGILHVGSSKALSKYEFGLAIADLMGIAGLITSSSVDDMDFQAKRSKNMALDVSRAQSLGIVMPSIEEDLAEMMRLYQGGYIQRLKGVRAR